MICLDQRQKGNEVFKGEKNNYQKKKNPVSQKCSL